MGKPAGTRVGRAGQYLRGTWAADGTEGGTEEPGGGIGKRTLVGRGEAPGQSASAAEGPTAKPSAWPPRCPREPSASEAVALMGCVQSPDSSASSGCCWLCDPP